MAKRLFLSGLVFVVFVACGLGLASRKLLWSDELLTQRDVIDRLDYHGIIVDMDINEGNISPFFYTLQRAICQLTGYRLPVVWKGEFSVYEPRGQIILRLLPVVCMAAAAAVAFFYFASHGSLGLALGAIGVIASQVSFWVFMSEARPYAVWFFLGTLQALLLLEFLEADGNPCRRIWGMLTGVNFLMSLTIVLSAIPVFITAVVIAMKCWKRSYRALVWAAGVPLGVCVAYYYFSKKNYAPLPQDLTGIADLAGDGLRRILAGEEWVNNFLMNVPPYWLLFIGAGAVIWFLRRKMKADVLNSLSDRVIAGSLSAFGLALLAAFILVSSFLSWQTKELGGVAQRYFIFLTPLAMAAAIVLTRYLWTVIRADSLWRTVGVISFIGIIVLSGLWSMVQVMSWGPFWAL